MKKSLILGLFLLFLLQGVYAEILFESQPDAVYNFGDSVTLPVSVKATSDIRGSLEMKIICGGLEQIFYKNGIVLSYGEQIKLSPAPKVVLTKEVIGELHGSCKITAAIGNEVPILTNEFTISSLINSAVVVEKTNLNPGENLIIEGSAVKESGTPVDGFAEVIFGPENSSINQITPVTKGYFIINRTLEENLKAGNYLARIRVYEINSLEEITNQGFVNAEFYVNQVPKNFEILVPNELNPDNELEIKTLLHDQTGENILTSTILIIKDSKGEKIEETIINTDESFNFKVDYNYPPENLTILAQTGEFSEEAIVNILENPKIKIELENDSLIITNIGNVPYCNESVLVKIGNESVDVDVCVEIDGIQKFIVTAPKGEYVVEVINEGETQASGNVALTGGAIGVTQARENIITLMKHPFVWIFIILVLGVMAFLIFKKGYRKSFFGYIKTKTNLKKRKEPFGIRPKEEHLINLENNKAEISLSIKGEKQVSTILCLKIKNINEVKRNKNAVSETMNKISLLASQYKTAIYENSENFFFIFSFLKTKTFKNEKSALNLAQEIKDLLENHNKLYKQPIDFGISINNGELVSKMEGNVLEFMSIKDAISGTKKISDYSKGRIVLTEPIVKVLSSELKTEKHIHEGTVFYTIVRYKDSEENEKFIRNFLKSIEKNDKKK